MVFCFVAGSVERPGSKPFRSLSTWYSWLFGRKRMPHTLLCIPGCTAVRFLCLCDINSALEFARGRFRSR